MYYQLRQTPVLKGLYLTEDPYLGPEVDWVCGLRHTETIPLPLEVELNDRYGTGMPDIFDDTPLLLSGKMVTALRSAGVDNFDAYEAVLVDEKRKKKIKGYHAVQIVGRVAAADIRSSKFSDPLKIGHTLIQFEDLKLDKKLGQDLLLFRLHESVSTIIIHEKVKKALDKLDLKYVTIAPVGGKVVPELDETDADEE